MSNTEFQVTKYKCNRCGGEWIPRQEVVKACPRCGSTYWNKPRVRATRRKEGYQLTLKGHQAFERIAIDRWKALYRKAVKDGDNKRIEELEAMVEEVTPSKNEGE